MTHDSDHDDDIDYFDEGDDEPIETTEKITAGCPFCGKTDCFVERKDFSSAYVFCNGCAARGPVSGQESDREEEPGGNAAIRAWNQRAMPDDLSRLRAMTTLTIPAMTEAELEEFKRILSAPIPKLFRSEPLIFTNDVRRENNLFNVVADDENGHSHIMCVYWVSRDEAEKIAAYYRDTYVGKPFPNGKGHYTTTNVRIITIADPLPQQLQERCNAVAPTQYLNLVDGKIYELISQDGDGVTFRRQGRETPHYLGRAEFDRRFQLQSPTRSSPLAGRWHIFEDATQPGYWGIELEDAGNDDDAIMCPIKLHRDTVARIVEAHNAALATSAEGRL